LPTSDDFTKSDSGEAEEKKIVIGRIENYWKNIGVAHVKIFTGNLSVGDEIYIQGKSTGLIRARIESMEINNKKVSKAEKGDVGIKLPFCRKNDEVYLIVKK
jgi:putative protease